MAKALKNVTFSLPIALLEKMKEYAKAHDIPSLNQGVREALEDYAKKVEKERLRKQMIEASQDPLFMKDLESSMKDFENSDAEISRKNEW